MSKRQAETQEELALEKNRRRGLAYQLVHHPRHKNIYWKGRFNVNGHNIDGLTKPLERTFYSDYKFGLAYSLRDKKACRKLPRFLRRFNRRNVRGTLRGTVFHMQMAKWAQCNGNMDLFAKKVKRPLSYTLKAIRCLQAAGIRPLAVKLKPYDEKLGIATEIDLLGIRERDGRIVVVEFKTGFNGFELISTGKMKGPLTRWSNSPYYQFQLQLLTTCMMLVRNYGIRWRDLEPVIIHVNDTKTPRVYRLESETIRQRHVIYEALRTRDGRKPMNKEVKPVQPNYHERPKKQGMLPSNPSFASGLDVATYIKKVNSFIHKQHCNTAMKQIAPTMIRNAVENNAKKLQSQMGTYYKNMFKTMKSIEKDSKKRVKAKSKSKKKKGEKRKGTSKSKRQKGLKHSDNMHIEDSDEERNGAAYSRDTDHDEEEEEDDDDNFSFSGSSSHKRRRGGGGPGGGGGGGARRGGGGFGSMHFTAHPPGYRAPRMQQTTIPQVVEIIQSQQAFEGHLNMPD